MKFLAHLEKFRESGDKSSPRGASPESTVESTEHEPGVEADDCREDKQSPPEKESRLVRLTCAKKNTMSSTLCEPS